MKNVFIENKKTILQICRANDVNDISVAANMASQMANERNSGKPVSYSLKGVEGFEKFCKDYATLDKAEIGTQFAEYNKKATEAIQRGEPWILD